MSKNDSKKKIKRLLFDTYMAVVENSVGSNLFRNFYADVEGKRTDIMKDGELSCAFFVSSVLTLFKLIKGVHGTVDATVGDLKENGWSEIQEPEIGSVLVWEEKDLGDGDIHRHIGFYVGDGEAISNSLKLKHPTNHNWNFNNTRRVDLILWNPQVFSNAQLSSAN